MKFITAVITLVCFFELSYAQNKIYNSDKFGYTLSVPPWLKIIETDTALSFGGTMPAVDKIENAILITGFSKNRFSSFDDFQRIYITGNIFGKETLYSNQIIWYGRNERDFKQIKNGVSSRVFTLWERHIYHNQFVLLETSKAYLWIQFTSTPTTYDVNIVKFNSFLTGLTLK